MVLSSLTIVILGHVFAKDSARSPFVVGLILSPKASSVKFSAMSPAVSKALSNV